MENFAKLFVRVENGMWKCVRDGKFDFPQAKIEVTTDATFTRGTTFNGFRLPFSGPVSVQGTRCASGELWTLAQPGGQALKIVSRTN